MNSEPFKRDQTPIDGDSLLPQLRATEQVYRTAYNKGRHDGYMEGLRYARQQIDEAMKDVKKQAG